MKKSFSFVLAALVVFFLVFTGCKIESSPSSKSVKKYNGTIYGKAFYSNTEDNSSIQITLDKTDGLRSAAVLESCGINDRSCYSIDGSSSDSRTVVSYTACDENGSYSFSNLEPGVYTVYALAKDSSERAVSRNISVVEDGKVLVPDLQLTATGSLSGKITVEGNESNNAGFVVFIAGTSYMAITGSNGSFTISDIPAGPGYEIVIMYGTYTYYWKNNVEVKPFVTTPVAEKVFTQDEYQTITNKQKGEDGKDGENGKDGEAGKDGTSIVWKGSFDSEDKLKNPQYLWAYFNTKDGCSYIYDGKEWTLLSYKGADGKDAAQYEIRTTDIPAGDSEYPAGAMKIEILKDGVVVETIVNENGASSATLINYNLNGGYFNEEPNIGGAIKETVVLSIPTKENSTFMGWYLEKDFSGDEVTTIKCDGTKAQVKVYAKWIPNLIVNYELNGGVLNDFPTIPYNGELSLLSLIPTKEDATFTGWYYEEDFSGNSVAKIKYEENKTQIKVYAKWFYGELLSLNELENYISTLTEEKVYPIRLEGEINFNILNDILCKVPEGIYIDLLLPYSVTFIDDHAFYNCSSLFSVTIPSSVTEIGKCAFSDCSGLTSVTIPPSVKYIADGVFQCCSGLKSVTIPSTVEYIADCAFSGCSGLTSIIIPSSVTSIGNYAFYGCSGLTSVTIPSSVTSIGKYAFSGCSGLTSIIIPSSVTFIGRAAFYDCSELTSIIIQNSATIVEEEAFLGCNNVTEMTIPQSIADKSIKEIGPYTSNLKKVIILDGVTSIGRAISVETPDDRSIIGTFEGCDGLTSVTIPSSVTTIGFKAFKGCSGLTSLTIPDRVTSIGHRAFCECTGLTSLTIPGSVTSIGHYAFAYCNGLVSVTIENGVKSIGGGAFFFCDPSYVSIPPSITSIGGDAFIPNIDNKPNLEALYIQDIRSLYEIDFGDDMGSNPFRYAKHIYLNGEDIDTGNINIIPDGITHIGSYALGSRSFTLVTIPSSVTTIGDYAFNLCRYLTSVTIPSSVTSIGNKAFSDCESLTTVIISSNVTTIADDAFYMCPHLTSVTIPSSVTKIVDDTYSGSVTIPSSVTTITDYAFSGCSGLTSVTIPSSVTSIGNYAFSGCSGLTSVTIPSSVTSIGNYAFSGCSGLTSVTIENGVTSIGNYAFSGCSRLTSVTIPSSVTTIGNNTFVYCSNLSTATIENGAIGDYAFSGCSDLTSVTIENGVTSIGNYAFSDCSDLTSVTIENGVTSIGNFAFYNCSGLTSVTIPSSVTSIGNYAFSGCSGLTSVTIENGVTSIGQYAFSGCSSLSSIIIPSSVTTIASSAFSGCDNLTQITVDTDNPKYDSRNNCNAIIETETNTLVIGCKDTIIPSSVTSIGTSAFEGCSELTSITIPSRVTTIGNRAFFYCRGLSSVTIPSSVTSIDNYAFYGCSGLTSVTIPSSVTEIGEDAFAYCSDLTSVTIENGVTSIGNFAFYNCSGLTSVTIPSSVTSIGIGAFSGCSSLSSIIIPSSVTTIAPSAFFGCDNLTQITVDTDNPKYDSRNNCNAIIETETNTLVRGCKDTIIPSSVTKIGDYAFESCSGLTSITIPSSVTEIGDYAFSDCSDLTSVTIENGVTSIGNYAFSDCIGLTSVTIPSSVNSIVYRAFYGCSKLKSLIFDDTTTWYRVISSINWNNKTGGTQTDVSNPATNAYNFTSDYSNYYLYKW